MAMLISRSGGRGRRRRPMADINVTPMVDVMLVLLVVFMITAPMLATGVSVTLPKTRAEQMPTGEGTPARRHRRQGRQGLCRHGGHAGRARRTSRRMLKALAENNIEKRVYVRADEAVPYGAVVNVLALLQRPASRTPACRWIPNAAKRILRRG